MNIVKARAFGRVTAIAKASKNQVNRLTALQAGPVPAAARILVGDALGKAGYVVETVAVSPAAWWLQTQDYELPGRLTPACCVIRIRGAFRFSAAPRSPIPSGTTGRMISNFASEITIKKQRCGKT